MTSEVPEKPHYFVRRYVSECFYWLSSIIAAVLILNVILLNLVSCQARDATTTLLT